MASSENFDLIIRARDEASAVLGNVTKAIGGLIGGYELVKFLKDSVSAAAESELAFAEMSASLERAGMSSKKTQDSLVAFTASIQQRMGIADEAVARSVQVFIDYGATASEAMDRVRVAADLAAAKHMDLESATQLLAKASMGATAMLGRYGIVVDESASSSEKFAQAIEQINAQFGGAAVAQMSTYAGQVKLLAQNYDDLKESVGRLAVPYLSDLASRLNDVFVIVNSNLSIWEKWNILLEVTQSNHDRLHQAAAAVREEMARSAVVLFDWDKAMRDAGNDADELADGNAALRSIQEINNRLFGIGWVALKQLDTGYETYLRNTKSAKELSKQLGTEVGKLADDWMVMGQKAGEAGRMMTDSERQAQAELAGLMRSGMVNASASIINSFFGVRANLAEIFKQMALDFERFFLNQILEKLAMSAALWLLRTFMPASGIGAITGPAFGGSSFGKISPSGPGGMGRPSAGGGVVININGDIIGDERFVRQRMIPQIERAAELNLSRLALAR